MATKKCINGHMYDAAIYGDHCPFCPPSESKTKVVGEYADEEHTRAIGGIPVAAPSQATAPTMPVNEMPMAGEAGTVIRPVGAMGVSSESVNNRQLVGIIVCYTHNPLGEVFQIYEGKNVIGRAASCDISFPSDSNISGQHLLILYREAEGVYWAVDQNSSNGTYINGEFASDRYKLSSNDTIVIGGTKLLFIAIPKF